MRYPFFWSLGMVDFWWFDLIDIIIGSYRLSTQSSICQCMMFI